MKTPKQTVSEWAKLIEQHDLKKSEICRRAGIQNSIYSYARKRGKKGIEINPEHKEKIEKAIGELIDEQKTKEKSA